MLALIAALILSQPPTITVTADDIRVDRSCRIVIASGTVIADTNADGVLHLAADGITVEFAEGSVLVGSNPDAAPDTFQGIGIRLDGHKNVALKNAHISGFKTGIFASSCPGLTIDTADLSGNYRQRLKSTPQAEDGADWLYPHNNDRDEWMTNHGAGLCVKNADKVTLRDIRIRRGQNGIILDRVTDSALYDNDCSFLSGWGLAMWRSSGNLITRNALDFCVRGYSHAVYNRGQDSAGLLMFEQCCRNTIAENSITHGGDGIFGFAGQEALGQNPPPKSETSFDYKRRGNSDNLFIANDLSYAPAHGLEMTFSAGNRVYQNRFVANAICGIWGGYSNDTVIAENTFDSNGEMAYGLERGGINIEHGSGTFIAGNTFKNNTCGVHLWWNNNEGLLKLPGVAANERGVEGNVIADNTFTGDLIALQLRDEPKDPHAPHVRGTVFANNTLSGVAKERDVGTGIEVSGAGGSPMYTIPQHRTLGKTHPVGARANLAGRENIVMTAWGPWDHESEFVRPMQTSGARHIYEVYDRTPRVEYRLSGPERSPDVELTATGDGWPTNLVVTPKKPGVHHYSIVSERQDPQASPPRSRSTGLSLTGLLVSIEWDLTVFPWEGPAGPNPPPDLAQWRSAAKSPAAVHAKSDKLNFPFGMGGPSDVNISPQITAAKFKPDHFGIIATTTLPLPEGKWRIRVISDDGIRVIADGKTIIENWTHHGAATDAAEIDGTSRPIQLTVEYFEIFGAAVLDLQIEPAKP